MMVYPISKKVLFKPLKLFLKKIEGMENIPKKSPFIVTSNYESYLDPWLIASVIILLKNKKIHFLAKRGRFWNFGGFIILKRWAGAIIVEGREEKAFQDLLSLLKKEEIVGIFIEGQRTLNGELQKGKTGVVRVGLKARVPILPIGIMGTFNIAPRNKLIPRLKRAELHIGKPIYLNKYYKQKINENLLRRLTDDIMEVISDLTGKPYNH